MQIRHIRNLWYTMVPPGRKSDFRAGFRLDSSRRKFKIGPPAGLGPAGEPILRFPRIEFDRNPAWKTDFRPGAPSCDLEYAIPEVHILLFLKVGSEIVDLGMQKAPCLRKTHPKGWGGEAPHPFPFIFGRQEAACTPQNQRFHIRLSNIRDFGPL